MTYFVIGLGLILILVLLYVVSYRKQLASLRASIEKMRQMATQEITYRPVLPQETTFVVSSGRYAEVERELTQCGLTVLGDRVEVQPDGTTSGVTRWFVESNKTVCGWFGLVPDNVQGTSAPAMMLFSESSSGRFFITSLGAPKIALANPPSIKRTYCDWGNGLARALEQHRAQATTGDPGGDMVLRRIEGIEDALALLARLRENVAKWREAQNPEALLEQDLHFILQHRYETLGPSLLKMMSSRRS